MMDALLKWMPLIVLAVQVLMAWTMWSLSQKFVSRDQCDHHYGATCTRLSELERSAAMAQVRATFDVTTKDLGQIYERINDIDRKVSQQGGELVSIRNNLTVIQQTLMEQRQ